MTRSIWAIYRKLSPKFSGSCKGVTGPAFDADDLLPDGVIRQMEITGEAAARLCEASPETHSEWDIRNMKGLRHVLIHGYADVDWDGIWDVAERDIPVLQKHLMTWAREAEEERE
ncbi:MAG: DUF86 domain-containing protein [Firmicutes bacterium]|jgi:uncharacterized protein with HEPN domain|uniref:DUF86 domain-containing protein n=1 Tax=Sulfobacillus benefaciens TaxID=453960 RepID=A0A2T2WQW8_9FIRM|nr:DUF86 domain-containing protein [Bacillota bacterium]PSR24620.1 MAG: hypothetical protein C7B43_18550 [Sulfobacillus benefaciens]HBQ94739.1 hypothetical protein [Sulfobacillus sp.]